MSEPKPIERHLRPAVDDADVDRMLRVFEGQRSSVARQRGSFEGQPVLSEGEQPSSSEAHPGSEGERRGAGAPALARARGWRAVAVGVGLAAAAAAGLWLARPAPSSPGPLLLARGHALPSDIAAREDPAIYELDDGSRIVLAPHTEARVTANEGRRLRTVISSGRATFDVTPGGPRRWIVDAGDVHVEVVGTRFTVGREAGEVTVRVERGHVQVDHPSLARTADLRAGDELRLPAADGRAADEPADVESAIHEPAEHDLADDETGPAEARADAVERVPTVGGSSVEAAAGADEAEPVARSEQPAGDWRRHAGRGDFSAAYEALGAEGLRAASQGAESEDLLLLADVARRSGHPREAEPLLRELASREPDPRAAVASFTLGRLLLDRGDSAGAATYFERVRASARGASLREDAMALEARARARAGDARAPEVARAYLSAFPGGRHAEAMRAIVQ